MKNTVKILVVSGGLLLVIGGCTNTASVANRAMRPINVVPPTLSPVPKFALESRVCRGDESLFNDCRADGERSTRSAFAESMQANVFDNLSGRVMSGLAGKSHKKNKRSKWRLKRDRVEWQYKF